MTPHETATPGTHPAHATGCAWYGGHACNCGGPQMAVTSAPPPKRDAAGLARDLRARADLLSGEPWERDATAAMMREAADLVLELMSYVRHRPDCWRVNGEYEDTRQEVNGRTVYNRVFKGPSEKCTCGLASLTEAP